VAQDQPHQQKWKDRRHEPIRLKNFSFLTKSFKNFNTPKTAAVVVTSLDLV
jgi:hypothetical protein